MEQLSVFLAGFERAEEEVAAYGGVGAEQSVHLCFGALLAKELQQARCFLGSVHLRQQGIEGFAAVDGRGLLLGVMVKARIAEAEAAGLAERSGSLEKGAEIGFGMARHDGQEEMPECAVLFFRFAAEQGEEFFAQEESRCAKLCVRERGKAVCQPGSIVGCDVGEQAVAQKRVVLAYVKHRGG